MDNKTSKNMKESASAYFSTINKNKENESDQAKQDYNLKHKLTNAFTDLEHLKKSLNNIRGTNEDLKSKPLINQTYDFFSDDRYRNVLDQIKHSNPDKNKHHIKASSKDKNVVSSLLGLIKPPRDSGEKTMLLKSLKENNHETPKYLSNTATAKANTKIDYRSNNRENSLNKDKSYKTQSDFRKFLGEQSQSTKNNSYQNNNNNLNNNLNNSNNLSYKDNSNLYTTSYNKYSYISLREEIERLKITNQILMRSNSELKCENQNLNKELDLQYQLNRNSMASSALHSSKKISKNEEDAVAVENENLILHYQDLTENLKASLETAKNHNEEFSELVEQVQSKQEELQKENLALKEQNSSAEKDLEKLSSAFEETKGLIERQKAQAETLEAELYELRQEKKHLEEKLFLAEEQIVNLISINESHLKTKKDNLDCIESLKQTIEIIKRGSGSDEENILEAKIKLEEMENTINQKNYVIKTMSDSILNFEKDREFFNLTLNNLNEEISDKDKFAEELEEKYRSVYSDFEKANMRGETLQVKLDESEQTITNLKTSINFINETMEEYKQDYDRLKTELESERTEKNKLLKSIEITKEKFGDLTVEIEDLQESKNTLQQKLLATEKILKEKKSLLKKSNFEKSSLDQQLQETKNNVETLKEELKSDKYAKLNEEFQNEISKSNEERLKKIEEMRGHLEAKSKEYEKSQEAYSENLKAKEDKLKELTKLLSKAESVNEQNERNFNEKVHKLNSIIEQLKAEIQQNKYNAESEKRNLTFQIEEFHRQVKEMQIRLNTSEENYSNLLKKNFGAVSSATQVISNSASDYTYKKNYEAVDYNTNSNVNNNKFVQSSDAVGKTYFTNANANNNINNIQSSSGVNANNYVAQTGTSGSNNFWTSLAKNNTTDTVVSAQLGDYETQKGLGRTNNNHYNGNTGASSGNNYFSGAAQKTYSADINVGSSYKSGTNTIGTSANYDSNLNFERLPKTVKSGYDKVISESIDIFNTGGARLSNFKKKINNEELDKLDLSNVDELLTD